MSVDRRRGKFTGIPVIYKGRQFRSLLEVRWACFFDLMMWPYEYEPFDLPGWIPDFLLLGKTNILVEVKPVVYFPKDIACEMVTAAFSEHWGGELMIVGASIEKRSDSDLDLSIGWLGEDYIDYHIHQGTRFNPSDDETWPWGWAEAGNYGINGRIDISSIEGHWYGRMFGMQGKEGWYNNNDVLMRKLWTEAGNLTQWRGKQSILE